MIYHLQFRFIRFIQIRMQILKHLQKIEDLKAQFINEDLKALFICHETPGGDFLTYELPIDINIHQLYLKTPVNSDKLLKNRRF